MLLGTCDIQLGDFKDTDRILVICRVAELAGVSIVQIDVSDGDGGDDDASYSISPIVSHLGAAPGKVYFLYDQTSPWNSDPRWWLYLLHEVGHAALYKFPDDEDYYDVDPNTGEPVYPPNRLGSEEATTLWTRVVLATLYGITSEEVRECRRWDNESGVPAWSTHVPAWQDEDGSLLVPFTSKALSSLADSLGLRGLQKGRTLVPKRTKRPYGYARG